MEPMTNDNKHIRIAIADDHRMIRELLVERINSLKDCKTIFAAIDGQQLLDYLETANELPDLCILDISMPVLNGYDTQNAIKKRWPGMKTLAMSIYEDEDCVVQMLRNGANGFVSKNWEITKLEDAILSIYYHGNYPAEKIPEDHLLQSKGIPTLTEREKEYLTLTCAGMNMEHIAEKMGVSFRTVEHYRDNVYHKLNVTNKTDLFFYVNKTGIVFMK